MLIICSKLHPGAAKKIFFHPPLYKCVGTVEAAVALNYVRNPVRSAIDGDEYPLIINRYSLRRFFTHTSHFSLSSDTYSLKYFDLSKRKASLQHFSV